MLVALLLPTVGAAQAPVEPARGFRVVGPSFIAIQVANVATAAQWYARAFGLSEVNSIEAEDGRYSIRLLVGPGLSVELVQQRGARSPPEPHLGLFKAGFYVDDIQGAWTWLRSEGADTDPAVFTDRALRARTFVFRDPSGTRLQVFERCGASCEG